jgi:hypothetical protein
MKRPADWAERLPMESMRRVGGGAQDDGRSDTHARVGYRRTAVFVSELALSAGGRRFDDRPHEGVERSPYRPRPRYCVWTHVDGDLRFRRRPARRRAGLWPR